MKTVVDTSALLALLYSDDEHNERAARLLGEAAEEGNLVINPIVYSELAADETFPSSEDLEFFLSDTGIAVETISRDVAFRAGDAFQTYLSRRGDSLQCASCGHETVFQCPNCGDDVTARQHMTPDFCIGAHAEVEGDLLSFDEGFFRDYFDVTVRTVTD